MNIFTKTFLKTKNKTVKLQFGNQESNFTEIILTFQRYEPSKTPKPSKIHTFYAAKRITNEP